MNIIQRLEHWGDTHHPQWLDILRVALGAFLCYKGIEFLQDMSAMLSLMSGSLSFGSFTLTLLAHYIVFAHAGGGFLIAVGILTRLSCMFNIPVLFGAIIFINAPQGLWVPFSELWLSILVLLALIYFLIIGNGRWSFAAFLAREEEK